MKHHPANDILQKFSSGELDESLSCIVSAHVEKCPNCRNSIKDNEVGLAEGMHLDVSFSKTKFESQLDQVMSKIRAQSVEAPPSNIEGSSELVIGSQIFHLPKSLRRINSKNLKWMSFGKKGKITRLKGDSFSSLLLIFLGPNEEVPLHSHKGTEYSYVISGSFSADGCDFESGDFSFSNDQVTHAPIATSADGCLLVSQVDQQLNFFQGFLSPLNFLVWNFLNWKFSRL